MPLRIHLGLAPECESVQTLAAGDVANHRFHRVHAPNIEHSSSWAGDGLLDALGEPVGARAKIRVMVKRILNKYGYPPDLQEEAVKTVLAQAELLSAGWAVG